MKFRWVSFRLIKTLTARAHHIAADADYLYAISQFVRELVGLIVDEKKG